MKNVLIASHVSEVYAPTYPLIRFLKKKFPKPICILHPFKSSSLYFIRDFFVTLVLSFYYRNKYDIYIGVNCLNALPGLMVKVFYPSKTIIYYSADYSTERFANPVFNKLYIWLDKFCSQKADFNWSISERVQGIKKMHGVEKGRNILAPDGVHLSKVKRREFAEVEKGTLVFVGHLTETKGVQDAILGLKSILARKEDVRLVIIGDGPYKTQLESLAAQEGLTEKVEFLGFMSNEEVLQILSKYAIGLAPYNLLDKSVYYCDPVKVKEYLAAGCPVVITDVPLVAQMVGEKRCGVVVSDFRAELAAAVQTIFRSEEEYRGFRQRARAAAEDFDWDAIYARAFARMKM